MATHPLPPTVPTVVAEAAENTRRAADINGRGADIGGQVSRIPAAGIPQHFRVPPVPLETSNWLRTTYIDNHGKYVGFEEVFEDLRHQN